MIFILTGVAAGILGGLLGVGGGLVVVPVLYFYFSSNPESASQAMHLALGSSLAFIVFNSGTATWTHARLGGVHWREVGWLAPGLGIGSLLGAWVAGSLDATALRWWFGAFLLLMSGWIAFRKKPSAGSNIPVRFSTLAGIPFGVVASLAGVGGGVMVVPWLLLRGIKPAHAVATSSFCTVVVAMIGAIGYIVFAGEVRLAWSTGYVHWLAVLGVAIPAMLSAPVGAILAHKVNQEVLRKCFALLLLAVGLQFVYGG